MLSKMIKSRFPDAKLHGSTQMSIVTPEGVHALKEMGISRAVLPKRVNCRGNCRDKRKTDLELEMFIHGALCMSVSGQCYLSSMLGREKRQQRGFVRSLAVCPFLPITVKAFDLSLKDLSLIRQSFQNKAAWCYKS